MIVPIDKTNWFKKNDIIDYIEQVNTHLSKSVTGLSRDNLDLSFSKVNELLDKVGKILDDKERGYIKETISSKYFLLLNC